MSAASASHLAKMMDVISGIPPRYDHHDEVERYQRLSTAYKKDPRAMNYTVSVLYDDFPETIIHVGSDRILALIAIEDLTETVIDSDLKIRLTQQARK